MITGSARACRRDRGFGVRVAFGQLRAFDKDGFRHCIWRFDGGQGLDWPRSTAAACASRASSSAARC